MTVLVQTWEHVSNEFEATLQWDQGSTGIVIPRLGQQLPPQQFPAPMPPMGFIPGNAEHLGYLPTETRFQSAAALPTGGLPMPGWSQPAFNSNALAMPPPDMLGPPTGM